MPAVRLGFTWNGQGQNQARILFFQMKNPQGGESIKTEGTAAEKTPVAFFICGGNAVIKALPDMFCF